MEPEHSDPESLLANESSQVVQVEQEVENSPDLDPEFKAQLERSLVELNENLINNREGSVIVFREDGSQKNPQEAIARRTMMAGLGVRNFQVEEYPSEIAPGGKRYLERIQTSLPGVEIIYADLPSNGRTISLAVNHDPTSQSRVAPTDIERIFRSAHTHEDWIKSIEQYGANLNTKQEEIRQARLLAIDIDECVLPSVDRRTASPEQLEQLVNEMKAMTGLGMTLVFNTGRSAAETQKVIEYFRRLGVTVNGAITEGGSISLRPDEDGQWLAERNPTIDEVQWQAVRLCMQFLDQNYIAAGLGHREPKISAVTFNLNENAEVTGSQVIDQLRELLISNNLPTDVVDKADVSRGGLQLFAGVDKAEGMRYIHALTGITKEETIAIGDSPGDLPMFSEAAVTAAPYNAQLRELGLPVDYQSPYDAEYGVVDIFRQIRRLKQTLISG